MRRSAIAMLVMCSVLGLTSVSCYTTKIKTAKTASTVTQTQRQWFTVGGLIGLSKTAGDECAHGLADAESTMGAVDVLIGLGLSAVTGVVGGFVCGLPADPDTGEKLQYSSCVSGFSALGPFLLGSRTVEYHCAE
jgi:hypothetical protein